MLPTDDEARVAILQALYEEKKYGQCGLQFKQLHLKLFIPWPILWYNLDYLEEEKLIMKLRKAEGKTSADDAPSYTVTEKGQMVMKNKEEYTQTYPFLAIDTEYLKGDFKGN